MALVAALAPVLAGGASGRGRASPRNGATCSTGSLGGVQFGGLLDDLFFFADGRSDANWQGASKGFVGNVTVNGNVAKLRTSGTFPYAGKISTNAATLPAWQDIVTKNPGQASAAYNQTALVATRNAELNAAFTQINSLPATTGYESRSVSSLNGINTQNGVNEVIVVNVTSGFSVSSKIAITGDAGDVFILRWDMDANFANGYQGEVKFQSGGAIVPQGGLTPGNFINVAGEINASGGGSNPPPPYPQGPRLDNGLGALITGASDFSGGGFFTGYWLTTGAPTNPADATHVLPYGENTSLSNGIFVGGWYTYATKFSMTSGTSGVHVCPATLPPPPETKLSVTKEPASRTFVAGGVAKRFILTARNTGDVVANDVVLKDTLPLGLEFVSSRPSSSCTFAAATRVVTCSVGTLQPAGTDGDTAVRAIIVRAPAEAEAATDKNIVVVYADGEPKGDDSAEVIIEHPPTPPPPVTLSVTKEPSSLAFVAGGPSKTYTLTAANTGEVAATDVVMKDTLPPGLEFVSPSPSGSCTFAALTRVITCAVGTLEPGATAVHAITVKAAAGATPATDKNIVVVYADGEAKGDDDADVIIEEPPPPPPTTLAVSKRPAGHTFVIGGSAALALHTYTLTARNTGTVAAADVVMKDTLPAGLVFVSSTPPGSCTFDAPSRVITCPIGTLGPGRTGRREITVRAALDAEPGISKNSVVVYTDGTPKGQANADVIVKRRLNVSIRKTGPATITAGKSLTYTLSVTNHGSLAADVIVTDILPEGLSATGITGAPPLRCVLATLTCTGTVPARESREVTITADSSPQLAEGSTLFNKAKVETEGEGENVGSPTEDEWPSRVSASAELTLAKALIEEPPPQGVAPGETQIYRLSVGNNGPSLARNVRITDTLPAGTTFVASASSDGCTAGTAPGTVVCAVGDLAPNESKQVQIGVAVPADAVGTLANSATADSDTPNNHPNASDTTPIGPPETEAEIPSTFTIAKTAPASVIAGQTASWTIKVVNDGPSDYGPPGEPLVVTDEHSPFVTLTGLTSSDANVTCSAVTCSITSLAAGQAATITATGLVHSDASGTLDNKATLETPAHGSVSADSTVVVERRATLKVTKSVPASVVAGDSIANVIRVQNLGPSDTTGTTVTDMLPAGLTFTPTSSCSAAGRKVTCAVGDLAAHASATVTINATVHADATGTLRNVAVARAEDAAAAHSNEAETSPRPDAFVSIAKAADAVGVPGSSLSWTITVLNQGRSRARGATVTDTLPTGLVFVRATGSLRGVHCAGSGRHVSCTLPAIPANTKVRIALVTGVPPGIVPAGSTALRVVNRAQVHVHAESRRTEARAYIRGVAGAPGPAPPPSLPTFTG